MDNNAVCDWTVLRNRTGALTGIKGKEKVK